MPAIVLKVRYAVKDRLLRNLRRCRDAGARLRYLIVVNVLNGRSARTTAEVLKVHNTTVYRVVGRFRTYGEAGLADGRCDNGADKVDDRYLDRLYRVVRGNPTQYGWRRPTWTRELLVETLVRLTGVRIDVTTMSRALARIQADRGLPVGAGRENAAPEPHRAGVGHAALARARLLRGRSGHPPQPQDRAGLDGPRPAEGGAHAG